MIASELNPNQYYIYINKDLTPWNIHTPNQGNNGFVDYYSRVLRTVDRQLKNCGLIFYVTLQDVEELPSYGKNVIVLILGDEFYRVPKYRHAVGAIFKCYGTHQIREQIWQILTTGLLINHSYLNLLILLQAAKNLVHRLELKLHNRLKSYRSQLKRRLRGMRTLAASEHKITPIYDIPLGYYNSEDLATKPFELRQNAVFFDGSVIHTHYPIWSLRYWTKTPKTFSRERMMVNLAQFKQKYPQYRVQMSALNSFAEVNPAGHYSCNSYSEDMMNSKICLVPRGTTLETNRFFEALRYGCIIVGENLPLRWFYAGAPVIQLADWQALEPTLNQLLANPQQMQVLHQQTLAWWQEKCSESVVGQYIVDQLVDQAH